MKRFWKCFCITTIMIMISFQTGLTKANGYYDTFVQTSDGWTYYDSDGIKVSNSWVYKDGTYFINEEGRITYGSLSIDGKEYSFDETGKLKNDWIVYKNDKFGMASGSAIKNKQFINGKQRYFYDESGNAVQGLQTLNGNLYYLTSAGITKEGFMTVGGLERYVFVGGKVATNQFIEQNQKKYYVDDRGIKKTGLQNVDGNTYYFDATGVMQTGILQVNNAWRHFGSDGVMMRQEWITIDNKTYYAKENGSLSYGLTKINEKYYYFDNAGVMQTGTLLVNNAWRHFGTDGVMKAREWFSINDKKYYAKENGSLSYGLTKIGDKTYYFDISGNMQTGTLLVNNAWRHFGADGAMKSAEMFSINGETYYAKDNGSLSYGLTKIENKTYFFDGAGVMQTGTMLANDAWRFFDENGVMKNSEWFKINDDSYYAKNGGFITYGKFIIKDRTHNFDAYGRLIEDPNNPMSGWVKDSKGYKLLEFGEYLKNEFRTIKGNQYYINHDGYRAVGFTNYQNSYFYFDGDGIMQKEQFINVGGWRYFNFGGIMPTNMWIYHDGKTYHADINGLVQYGEQTIEGRPYYFDTTGAKYQGFAIGKSGNQYYFKYEGGIAKDEFITDNNAKYYMDKNGISLKGMHLVHEIDYCFDKISGAMIVGFYTNDQGLTYYFLKEGGKVKGFLDQGLETYYFDMKDGVMALGYKTVNGRNYHFDESNGRVLEVSANLRYYNQKDSRWGGYRYGGNSFAATGCVPTAASMIFSFLTGEDLHPDNVGDWAYDNGYYNNGFLGSQSSFWGAYSDYKDVSYKNNITYEEAVLALKHGGILAAAMNPGIFTRPGSTHEIVIFGIDQYNMVSVYDPYYTDQNGKYSLSDIFVQKSTDYDDCLSGGPIFALGA